MDKQLTHYHRITFQWVGVRKFPGLTSHHQM